MGKHVHIKSFGCQMNKLDTALVRSALDEAGFSLTEKVGDADVVLINTCSVREHAEQRVLSHLGHLKHIKKSRPDLVVGVIGCMAQRLGDELLEHEAVNIVCGPAEIPQISELITKVMQDGKKSLAVTAGIRRKAPAERSHALEEFEAAYGIEDGRIPAQAFVRVMRGCNNFCSYCVVPYVRGPEISRPPEAIIEQIRKLADHGTRQVTLLGQTVNSYKYEQGDKTWSLADLLGAASDINGIEWLRFVTSYPSDEFFDEIMQIMADSPKVCNYLHIPAQSGSDKILRAMNRNYSCEWYLELLDRARAVVPGISIAGDFIVGFPGETEEDFQATVDLLRKAWYKNAFIFKYSPRPGTRSDKRLQDTVPAETKQRRNVELLAVQEKISDELSRDFLGRRVKVLVEGPSKKAHLNSADAADNPQLAARTATDYIVVFNGPESLAGRFADVKIIRTSPLTLFGEPV
ncbi:MAG: tRNA (N6-isopentenyl adenosine(37)-C2)-methylthiotransferase MiaB [Planctomycetes bacterium B3_Pla]|nr:MAG: tRNA (N6-isopentenyl adenosine(37)-C2)-methylthiotransferase MiaB [Planctomycetes bacterium B3_Pla]